MGQIASLTHAASLRTGGRLAAVGLLAVLVSVGCAKQGRELQPGSYRATVETPHGREVAFELDVAREERGPVLYLINGDERVRVTEVAVTAGRLVARMPGYENELHADVRGDTLSGQFLLMHPGGKTLAMPFRARLGETWRFVQRPLVDNADLEGRWVVTSTEEAHRGAPGVADLRQRFGRVTGTVLTAAGDQGLLAGDVHDEELKLSRFDGGAVVLYEAKLDAAGRLIGQVWSDREGQRHFVARRDPDAVIATRPPWTRVSSRVPQFQLAGRDLDGQRVTATDPPFTGKVLLVSLTGSWSPAARDEAVTLESLRREFGARGLEAVALMFEQHADVAQAAAAIRRYREALGVGYPTLLGGTLGDADARQAWPGDDDTPVYPSWLVIDRDGALRAVFTGYFGSAAPAAREQRLGEVRASIEDALGGEARLVPVSPGSS